MAYNGFWTHNTLVKFFSGYTDKKQQDKFLSLILILPLVIAILLGGLGVIFYNTLLDFFDTENSIVQPYVWTIFVLAIALAYFEVFFAWSKVKLKSVFGNMMKEVFLRLCICMLLFSVYFHFITIEQFIYGVVAAYVLRTVIMLVYALHLHKIKFTFSVPQNYSAVYKYSFLILIAGSVATLLIDLDKTMIERYLPIENVAKYGICAYIASVIIIPSRAMHQITYPLTAKLINEKKMDQLAVLYKKSAINLIVISGLLFVLILCNVTQLFEIIPKQYELYIWVVVLIGSVKLFDSSLGNNNAILYSSDYYRLVLYIGVGMAILSLLFNMIFIPLFGVTGAAIATFSAVFCYNLAKLWIVKVKFNMQPFSRHSLLAIGLILIFTFGFYFWELPFSPIPNIILKSVIISLSYGIILYFLKISSDINTLVDQRIRNK